MHAHFTKVSVTVVLVINLYPLSAGCLSYIEFGYEGDEFAIIFIYLHHFNIFTESSDIAFPS